MKTVELGIEFETMIFTEKPLRNVLVIFTFYLVTQVNNFKWVIKVQKCSLSYSRNKFKQTWIAYFSHSIAIVQQLDQT